MTVLIRQTWLYSVLCILNKRMCYFDMVIEEFEQMCIFLWVHIRSAMRKMPTLPTFLLSISVRKPIRLYYTVTQMKIGHFMLTEIKTHNTRMDLFHSSRTFSFPYRFRICLDLAFPFRRLPVPIVFGPFFISVRFRIYGYGYLIRLFFSLFPNRFYPYPYP